MALPLSNTFETGLADETTITTANSGDGSAGNAFDVVQLGAGGIVYDNLHAAHGTLSAKVTTGTGGSRVNVQWDTTSLGSETTIYGRMYAYRTANPTGGEHCWLFRAEGTGGSGTNAVFVWGSDGDLYVFDTLFNFDGAGITLPLNEWVRFEFKLVTHNTTGEITAIAYSGDSTTPLGTASLTNTDTNDSCEAVSFGDTNDPANASDTFWIDDVQVNDTGFPGPAVSVTVAWLTA